ncbi:peptidase domain-containing ABC transporter [Pelomonas sp. SE-A7]|uniref:peptidase domain-containing ABC transporter n=1 Tax=Pelomonas sp. SE-A7 TaxID=3054953 RepID=UPI00259D28CA|nr:peptidase domain-containing ABC transporter [Pelomonas sp. SE-A7]MDM4768471.1 peptidase domain-containing ABC transporter [Pelomonas sp. SE-A7]
MSEALLSQLQWGKRRRLPLLLQTEAAECGLACLAMVAGAHGHHVGLAELRARFAISLKGCTAADLVRMADGLGLACRALRAEPAHLARLQLPCILHWDFKHFVVLAEVQGDQAVLHDPAHGRRTMAISELSRHFTGVALELRPGADFQTKAAAPAPSLRQLLGRVQGLHRALGQALLLAVLLELLTLLSPFLLQWTVDGVLVGADHDLLYTLGAGFALLVLLQVAVGTLRSWAVLALSASLNLQWLSNVFAHLLRLPQAWFDKRSLGEIWSRFGSVQQIQRTLTTRFVEAVLDGLMVLLTLAMMWLYSPRLSGLALLAVAGYGLLRWAFYRPLREATEEALIHEARQNGFFVESMRGAAAIKLLNAEPARSARFSNLVVEQMNASLATRRLELWMGVSHKLLFGLERVAIVCLGAWLVLERELSVGMLFAFLAYKEQFSLRLAGLIDKGVELAMLKLQGQRLADIVLSAPEAKGGALPLPEGATLELREVTFRYADGEPEVIKGCSFTVAPGESVALTGPSGCGKTTLMKLMLGMHEPQSGQVLINGTPLAKLGLQSWRSAVGAVLQDDQLFAGSIADNISFFEPGADPAWVRECARLACVAEEIEALPMGYQSLVSDMGSSLSGGQRQRILLARALYKKPQFLLLDEATSALDVDRERQLNASLRQLPLTKIVIAHRPETIASAQRVIALQGGRVAQDLRNLAQA